MIILKLRDERKNKEIETTQRRVDNWLGKDLGIIKRGNQYIKGGRILYKT